MSKSAEITFRIEDTQTDETLHVSLNGLSVYSQTSLYVLCVFSGCVSVSVSICAAAAVVCGFGVRDCIPYSDHSLTDLSLRVCVSDDGLCISYLLPTLIL